MFHFAYPWFLLLLLAVPWIVRRWLRRRRGALRYPSARLFAGLPLGRSTSAQRWGAALRGLALVLLIFALAGPRFGDWHTRIPTEGVAIEIVLDVSGSMGTRDFRWEGQPISRLDAAKQAFRLFVAGGKGPGGVHLMGRPNDWIGLVTFARWHESAFPLTLSHAVLLRQLDSEQPRTLPGEAETNISDAVTMALHRLEGVPARRKLVVLISDGEHNVPRPGSGWTPRQTGQIAANLHLPIYTIDAGGDPELDRESARTPTPEELRAHAELRASGEGTLRSLAKLTSGRHFQARDTEALLNVCGEIDRLEKHEIESFQYRRYYEGFPWFGLAVFGTLAALQLLERTVWQRVP
jgi:Ca-activated chloride channel family protein